MKGDHQRTSQVRVGVRVRPLASKEIQQGGKVSLTINLPASITIAPHNTFTYDAVFDSQTDQDGLYSSVSTSLLASFVEGYNATILAYGQTGSGKTYTMGSEAHTQPEGSPQVGLIPRFISDFFHRMNVKKEVSDEALKKADSSCRSSGFESTPPTLLDYHMKASFLEVYGEDVYDLLDSERKSLPLREDSAGGVVIAGLTSKSISDPAEALHVLHEGTNNRTTAATLMNLTSSRSHAVFTIDLTQRMRGQDQVDIELSSKFTFVDLAGSERMKKTGAEGERAREGIKINEGLLALGNVINALADDERLTKDKTVHVPYRQSKLTRLLQDALGGNSQTLFLACVSPSDTNVSETLSTLRYANRARNIQNAPTKNLDAVSSEMQRLNTLTRVLQSELIKARFQGVSNESDLSSIGTVDDSLAKRADVENYLELIRLRVYELAGVDKAPTYTFQNIGVTSVISSSKYPLPMAPIKVESSTVAVEATPSKGVHERFDDTFFIDVNPDEDMAILDRLLELQQQDHEYDKAKKRDDDSLRQMNGELQKEENLLLQLRESLKAYHSLKKKYEELMAEVQQLEAEKENLAAQLEKATADPSIGCSAAIKRQLEKVELSLNRARRETLTHRQKYKEAENQARRCQVLERKIADLKQAKTALLKRQKETEVRYKDVIEAKTKELLALKRKEKAADIRFSKMNMEINHHKSNLEKRRIYCAKLSDKLKQTQAHLMKLLSIRQRDLADGASLVACKGSVLSLESLKENDETVKKSNEIISSDDLKAIQFITDRMVADRIEQALLLSQYSERVAEYSATMRLVVTNVKTLQESKESLQSGVDEKGSHESIAELRETVAELELKLEILGAEIKELETMLPNEGKQMREEEAVRKLMSRLPAMALRKMLFESFTMLVQSEAERKVNQELIRRKDAAISSLENELDMVNGKVDILTQDLINRKVMTESGDDLFVALKQSEEEKKGLEEKLTLAEEKIEDRKRDLAILKDEYDAQEVELETVQDALTLAQTSLAKLNGSVESEVTLNELQVIWKALGVDKETRSKIREEIKSCISSTCKRHLDDACKLKTDTESELLALREKKCSIQAVLGITPQKSVDRLMMLEEVKILREQVKKLESTYMSANFRRERIIADMISLSSTLRLSKHELPESLHTLMQQIEKIHACTTSIGRLRRASMIQTVQAMVDSLSDKLNGDPETTLLVQASNQDSDLPPGSLDEKFLLRCEDDVAELRIRKSEMLVKNRENLQKINSLVRDLHSNVPDLVELVEMSLKSHQEGIPLWWNADEVCSLLRRLKASSPRADVQAFDTYHLEVIYDALSNIAGSRRSISTLLREIVEKAQQKLLDIVGRELDASEAYATFHNALLQLPSLSFDFCHACIAEMETLVLGIEAMIQSEIEALTVVWEALNISRDERRAFWGRIDCSNELTNIGEEDLFDRLKRLMIDDTEEWISSLLAKGRKVNKELETKLGKLDAIHSEVERLRSKQDTKSQILSMDAEIRILNARLLDFEDLQCSKQRLLTKKSGSAALLKEARFRKQMKAKFAFKLGQLASLLRSWELEEGHSFDASFLSDDARMLLKEPEKMESWIERRTKLMPSRTVPATTPRKRSIEDEQQQPSLPNSSKPASRSASGITPPRKKIATSARQTQTRAMKSADKMTSQEPLGKLSPIRKRKPISAPSENIPEKTSDSTAITSPAKKRAAKVRRKESATLPPFGRILSEISSPDPKGSRR